MKTKRAEILVFTISFLVLLMMGILLTYNYKMAENTNLLFDSDTERVIWDATEIIANHYRISVHPLFIILVQPAVFLLKGIVLNKMMALVILSSFVSALSVLYIYKILSYIKFNPKINLLLCAIYLFSFANMVFTAGIEVYNFATLFLLMLWYYFLKQQEKEMDKYAYGLLILLGILSAAITITNFALFLIVIFLLWINKKISIKNIIIVGIITVSSIVALNVFQRLIWTNTPVLVKSNPSGEMLYVNKWIKKDNIKNVLINDYYNAMISSNIKLKIRYDYYYTRNNYVLTFDNLSLFHFLFISAFYIITIFVVARNYKKNLNMNRGLILALAFNTFLHFIYGNDSTFIYALHFVYLPVLLLGINLLKEENKTFKKLVTLFLCFFFLVELITNNIFFIKILKLVNEIINKNYLLAEKGLVKTILREFISIVGITVLVFQIPKIIRMLRNTNQKKLKRVCIAGVVGIAFLIEMVFISFEATNNAVRDKRGNNFGTVYVKEKREYLDKDFKKYFNTEISQLSEYRREISEIKSEYQAVSSRRVAWSNYYYFGMANRKKLLFNEDELIDIEEKKVIKKYDIEETYIIPNEYMVLIETKQKDFIKIYEDEDGVHINKNHKDSIIKGTEQKLNLYSFEGYRYKNTLKTLYGELLFNIKEGTIYPNIIVYEKPWYRDAALASMVLQKTNNTDLIKDWVLSITEMYDKQNAGEKEPDNLGELLYLLSTQEERNEEFIDQIEEEANRIAEENENGYYLYGKTDFGDMYLYQNLWYKLGIESVGREFHFGLDSIPKDLYSKMAWWSDYEVEGEPEEVSLDYPYLTYAMRHKLGKGQIPINNSLYPLSLEINASQANYENYKGIDLEKYQLAGSPLHAWSASELMLLLMDEE